MIRDKTKKDKIIEAYPSVNLLSSIMIKDKEQTISIGSFSVDGGLYVKHPYELVKKEVDGISGELTYYNFIKSSKKMCKQEKALRAIEAKHDKRDRDRKKELQEELDRLNDVSQEVSK